MTKLQAGNLVQNTGMRISELSHRQQLWLAESIRQLERDAWLDDRSILRHMAASTESLCDEDHAGAEPLVLERARRLAEGNPIVSEIANEMRHVQTAGHMLAIVLAILAFLGGIAAAATVLGGSTTNTAINIVLAWTTLLGMHLLTLTAWSLGFVLAPVLSSRHIGFTRSGPWAYLTRRLFGGRHRLVLLQASSTLVARSRVVFWTYSLLSHTLWCLFFLSATATLAYLFALHEYRFNWETTILPASFFVRFVELFGWLPQQLGLRVPDATVVSQLIDNESTRQAWAAWILSGVVGYGLFPRLLLAGLSLGRRQREGGRLTLDLEQPYYARLRQRLDSHLRPAATVVDPATGHALTPHIAPHPRPGGSRHETGNAQLGGLIFGFELHDDLAWPPNPVPDGVLAEGKLSSPDDRDALLERLAQFPPQRLVAACDARTGLDRGTLHFLAEVAGHAEAFGVLLLKQRAARPGRADNWKEELRELGIPEANIFSETNEAMRWLGERN